jgi:hypothetical protein
LFRRSVGVGEKALHGEGAVPSKIKSRRESSHQGDP